MSWMFLGGKTIWRKYVFKNWLCADLSYKKNSMLNSWIMFKKIWDRDKCSNKWEGDWGLCFLFKLWYLVKISNIPHTLAGHYPFSSPGRGYSLPNLNF